MDIFTKKKRSAIMAAIKGKETRLEASALPLFKEAGMRLRTHPKGIPGNPDAANKARKIAVFVDSEFWHGFDWENRKRDFKSKREFWIPKIERNIARDKEVNRMLKKAGWTVIRLWEKDLARRRKKHTIARLSRIWIRSTERRFARTDESIRK